MKLLPFAIAWLLATAPTFADESLSVTNSSIQIIDVPRETQMGNGPAPEGAPGNGRYTPPTPANRALPTLWIIGDSTVRNGTLGDGSNLQQWGWGAPIVAFFNSEKIEREPASLIPVHSRKDRRALRCPVSVEPSFRRFSQWTHPEISPQLTQ